MLCGWDCEPFHGETHQRAHGSSEAHLEVCSRYTELWLYKKVENLVCLTGYSDSNMAGDVDDRKSTTGVIYYLGSNPISWISQKQKVVALSSCEAEYIAATTATCQGISLARLLGSLLSEEPAKVQLKVDNQSTISLSRNPVFHDRSKHIDTRYHFVRDCVETGKVDVEHVETAKKLADILTKSLGRVKFQEMRTLIGMKEMKTD